MEFESFIQNMPKFTKYYMASILLFAIVTSLRILSPAWFVLVFDFAIWKLQVYYANPLLSFDHQGLDLAIYYSVHICWNIRIPVFDETRFYVRYFREFLPTHYLSAILDSQSWRGCTHRDRLTSSGFCSSSHF